MLNEKELVTLAIKLEAPIVINGIIDSYTKIEDDEHFALHDLISDLQPDAALLTIAFAAKRISCAYKNASPSMRVLNAECDRVIAEYGALWLDNVRGHDIDEETLIETLIDTSEDLETISELLEVNSTFLKSKDEVSFTLCNILTTQAKAQILIAEAYFEAANIAYKELEAPQHIAPETIKATDNVIMFPGAHA